MTYDNAAELILTLILLGVILYLVNLIPMIDWMRSIVNCVAAVLIIFWVLGQFGFHPTHHFLR